MKGKITASSDPIHQHEKKRIQILIPRTRNRTNSEITSPSSANNNDTVDATKKIMSPKIFFPKKISIQTTIADHTTVDHKDPTTEPFHRKAKVVSKIKSNDNCTYKIKKVLLMRSSKNGTK